MNEILLLCLIASVAAAFALIHYYKKFTVDQYRQDIFAIRDQLFSLAADGQISFDHPAYAMARTYLNLNGTIRYTERLSIVRMVIAHRLMHAHRSEFQEDLERKLEGLNESQTKAIKEALGMAALRTIVYLVEKNVFSLVAVIALHHAVQLRQALKLSKVRESLTRQYTETYDDLIYDVGSGQLRNAY